MNRVRTPSPRTREKLWTRALTSVADTAGRLVCCPHSGGAAGTFRPWATVLPPDVELLAVQYPGHADRFAEAPAAGIAEMGGNIAAELLRMPPAPCALFGHSLGALVAYETARALQDAGSPAEILFVSGAAAPWTGEPGTTHRLSDDRLWSAVTSLGGIDPEVAGEPELRDLLLPVLRSDLTLHETYRPAPDAGPLHCPVRAYRNTADPLVDAAGVAAWSAAGDGGFSTRAWPGGHFALISDPAGVVADILAALAVSGVPR